MKTLKNILLVTFPTIVFIFLVLELASMLFFPGAQSPKGGLWDEENKINKFSQEYGATGLFTIGNLSQQKAKWRINNEGWNSPVDYYSKKKEGVKRIAVIGDSYVEAFQVDIEKSFPYVLADLMGEHYEAYSFGTSGAPLSQYLNFARYVEKVFSPEIYIFTLVHNDFDESVNGLAYKPMYLSIKVENNTFKEVQPVQLERTFKKIPLSSILKKSSFMRFLYSNLKVKKIFIKNRKDEDKTEMNVLIEDVLRNRESIKLVATYLLETIKSELKGKEIIFIMDAPRWNIYKGELEKARTTELNAMAAELCNGLNLPFIDLTPYMLANFQINGKRYETDYDGHWNEYGHEFVANVLYKYLLNNK